MAPFERFTAWQHSHRLVVEVYRATGRWPVSERFGLAGQVRRAAVSIPTNIAEGSAKRGSREFRRYLDIALGSLAGGAALLIDRPSGDVAVFLLDAVVTRHYDYLVDPELLDEVTDMADGYRVVDGEEAEDGEGQEAAQEWLDAFASLPKESGLQQLYGDPDLVGAGADASKDILTRALDATRDAGRSLTVVAAPRRVSRAALSDLAGRGIAVISPAVDSGSPWVLMGGAKVSGVYAPSSAPSRCCGSTPRTSTSPTRCSAPMSRWR